MHPTTSFSRGKGQPDRDIYHLLATLNQELVREKHDILGLYKWRLRSHARGFEDLKRKWEDFTGIPVPKKPRTLEAVDDIELVAKTVNFVNSIQTSVIDEEVVEEEQPIITTPTDPMAITASVAQTTSSAPPTTMPPHPDDRINVDNMVVNDLRKELKKRQLATAGRKAELQERLREYLVEANMQREIEWASKYATDIITEGKIVQMTQVQNSDNNLGGCNDDANQMDVDDDMRPTNKLEDVKPASVMKKEEITHSDARNPAVESVRVLERVVQPSSVLSTAAKKQGPKSALKPSKYPSSVIKTAPQLAVTDTTLAPESMPRSFARVASPCLKQPTPNKISNSSTESSTSTSAVHSFAIKKYLQTSASKLNESYSLVHTTPGTTASRTGGAESASLLQKKQATAAANEARKIRIDGIRQKAKPVTTGEISATKPPPSHSKSAFVSSLKIMAPNSAVSESKRNPITNMMREKVAAQKTNERADLVPPTIPSQTVDSNRSMSTSSTIDTTLLTQIPPSSQHSSKPHPTALTNIMDPGNKPTSSPKKVPEKQLSPMQTYEMSDREDSDSDSESDEEDERQRPKKAIPLWAQKPNLHRALERQFADGPNRLDPDKIFGEVLTCNLEDIFDKKKSRYQRRTSSGNWTKDHVTLAEKLTYKRTMGYDEK